MQDAKELKECLCCGSEKLKLVLDLNEQPLANSFKKTAEEDEPTFPLRLNICEDCTHLQLSHAVNPDLLFKNYLYVSGTSQTLRDYFDWFAKETLTYAPDAKTALDIACNDGSQLNSFKALGLKTFGVDPAENLHPLSNANHEVVCDYFKEKYVYHYKMKQLDIITAQNVFAHNPNPLEFLQTVKKLMSEHTLVFIQTSQADMVLNNEFDTIYHEHINFFNINSMNKLAKRAGLHLVDVIKTPIHGNSYVFVLSWNSRPYNIQNLIKMESKLNKIQTYDDWVSTVQLNMSVLKSTIQKYTSDGYKVVGYGAAAKGNTLLNYINVPLDLIIDDSPLKQNMYAPGTNSPIKSIDALKEYSKEDKILFMPLAWNFFTEISQRIKQVRDEPQDLFLKYFPEVEVK